MPETFVLQKLRHLNVFYLRINFSLIKESVGSALAVSRWIA